MFCKQCGKPIDDGQELCEDCAKNANAQQATQNTTSNNSTVTPESKSKLAAGLLGIFLGGWGIHNFYLGFTGKGIAQIIVTIVTCGIGSLWGFIEETKKCAIQNAVIAQFILAKYYKIEFPNESVFWMEQFNNNPNGAEYVKREYKSMKASLPFDV